MGRQIALALVLMGVIALLLALDGLPWGGMRGAGPRPAGNAATAAAPTALPPIARPEGASDSDAMAILTRQVVQGLRQALPDPASRLQTLAQAASRAMPAGPSAAADLQAVVTTAAPLPVADPLMPRQRPARVPRSRVVGPGDTLTTIAETVYGRASAWQAIYAANRDRLSRPDLLPQGTVLLLPVLP